MVSVVGRYLEHSRLYLFGEGEGTYLSSADLMSRNTTRRVEAAAPVTDPELERRVRRMFRTLFSDNVKGRLQRSDGSYLHRAADSETLVNGQEMLAIL